MDKLLKSITKYEAMLGAAKEDDEKAFALKRLNILKDQLSKFEASASSEKKVIEKKEARKKIVSECAVIIPKLQAIIREIQGETAERNASKTPVVKKKVSTLLSEGIVKSVRSAVLKEMTRDKVSKINVESLSSAKLSFSDALAHLRDALGGISSSNDTFIKSFIKTMDELISEVEEKQKSVKIAA
jgi:hypothetical protein